MGPGELQEHLAQVDERHGLFPPGGRVVLAVSGGVDSMVLLDALASYLGGRGVAIVVAHLDHGLRDDSVDDAAFVAHEAARRGVPAELGARDVDALATAAGWSLEEAARKARYGFLAGVARKVGAEAVATAHHADDQAETVLMNVLRGAGLAGLAGMRHAGGYPLSAPQIGEMEGSAHEPGTGRNAWPPRLLRPLLDVRRGDLEAYAATGGVAYREDPTNLDRRFLRNRVRHDVLPVVEAINPRVVDALCRLALATQSDLRVVEELVDAAWRAAAAVEADSVTIPGPAWSSYSPGLARHLVRRAAAELGVDLRALGWEHVESILELTDSAGPLHLPGGVQAALQAGGLLMTRSKLSAAPPPALGRHDLPLPGRVNLPGGWVVEARKRPRVEADPAQDVGPWTALIDGDRLKGPLAVRGRAPGDRIQPLGMGGKHKSLQDLFTDEHVPQAERDAWPIVVDGEQVIWVPGLRMNEAHAVGDATRRIVELSAHRPQTATASGGVSA